MTTIDLTLDYTASVVDWLISHSDAHLDRGEIEPALRYLHIAGRVLSTQNRDLASPRIEKNLQLAAGLIAPNDHRNAPARSEGARRCLHVLTEALPAGGLTAMAARWITNDVCGSISSVALLSQEAPLPLSLRQAVEISGGAFYMAPATESLSQRAVWLRNLAHEQADCVILHVDLADVVCCAAFGTRGGPPVLLVNHAAHLYWNGASIADLVVNCRGSKKETLWTSDFRGIGEKRCATVPIPLEPAPDRHENLFEKREFCKRLNVPEDSVIVLTVGSAFKFQPAAQLDFVQTWEEILSENTNAALVAIGFVGDQRWKDASARLQNRIVTLGTLPHTELLEIFDLADIYTEAFPFGTTTSLLEAGLHGVPVCLAPAQAPPPYATDGVAVDEVLTRPHTVEAYKQMVTHLCRDVRARSQLGQQLRQSIQDHHTGDGWLRYVNNAFDSLPGHHMPLTTISPARTPKSEHELWTQFSSNWNTGGYEIAIETAIRRAYDAGLAPHINEEAQTELARHKEARRGASIPTPLLAFIVNTAMPILPARFRARAFGVIAFFFKGSLGSRLFHKIKLMTGIAKAPPLPYHEYAAMREKNASEAVQADGRAKS